jgi:hypothetical protein
MINILDGLFYIISFLIILYFIYIYLKNLNILKTDIIFQKQNKKINEQQLLDISNNINKKIKTNFKDNFEENFYENFEDEEVSSSNTLDTLKLNYKKFMNIDTDYNFEEDNNDMFSISDEIKNKMDKNYILLNSNENNNLKLDKNNNDIRLSKINKFRNMDLNTDVFYYKLFKEQEKQKKFNPNISVCREKQLFNKKSKNLIYQDVKLTSFTDEERKLILERVLDGLIYPRTRNNLNKESQRLFIRQQLKDKKTLSEELYEEKYKWLSSLEKRYKDQKKLKNQYQILNKDLASSDLASSDSTLNSNLDSRYTQKIDLLMKQISNILVQTNNLRRTYKLDMNEREKLIYQTQIDKLEKKYKEYKNSLDDLMIELSLMEPGSKSIDFDLDKTLNNKLDKIELLDNILLSIDEIKSEYDLKKMDSNVDENELLELQNKFDDEIKKFNDLVKKINKYESLDYANIKIFLEDKEERSKIDIMTDYNPYIFNCQRPWNECQFINPF